MLSTIHKFVTELRSGAGANFGIKDTAAPVAAPATKPKLSSANPDEVKPSTSAPAAATKSAGAKGSGRTLNITENFYCRAGDLYECFTHEGRVRAFTQVGVGLQRPTDVHVDRMMACTPLLSM